MGTSETVVRNKLTSNGGRFKSAFVKKYKAQHADNDISPRNLIKLVSKPVLSIHEAFKASGSVDEI
jgi:hypothetical protein